jgi:deoxycytidine triphosphate deaminase
MPDLTTLVDGIVHEPTQTEGRGLDLTLDAVYEVEEPGRVDFGGGELADADLTPVPTEKRTPDDDYGWWHLAGGAYLVEHNEDLATDDAVLVQPRDAVLARGAFHPTVRVTELPHLPLTVANGGIRLKENARVSTLLADG